ncbi:MAG: cytochrome-c peroxidase [Flavobacteriaceae bacterium]|nr:cytochrome-c peroxidase [Flavobacteriaceae bacterium]
MGRKFHFFRKTIILLCLILGFSQCTKKEEIKPKPKYNDEYDFVFIDIQRYFGEPIKAEYANKVGNEFSKEKVVLGEKLYNEKRLSKDNTVSCASCHDLKKGGTDNLPNSKGIIGADGKPLRGDRNAPSVINAALHFAQFWDGRAKDVEEQAGGPILNPIEMGMKDSLEVEQKIRNISEYKSLFKKAFPTESQPITFENITKAIASFERTLIKPSRFDKFVAGDIKALTYLEKKGLHLFKENTCATCHSGILLGGERYRMFGRSNDYWTFTNSKPNAKGEYDAGRYNVTKEETDKYYFKVPSLRNVEKTFPYFHDGSVADLKQAIKIMGKAQLGKDFTEEEIDALEAFLKSLTSEE